MKSIAGPGKSSTSGGSTAGSSRASQAAGSASTSDALRVGAAFVDPADVWRFERDRLIESSQSMDAASFRSFVERESARLVRDAVTERLLYQEAVERIAPQVDKNVENYIDAEIRKIVTEGFGGVQRRYERDLQGKGVSLAEVREKMRREVIIAGYLDGQIKPKIVEPSRGDLLAAYEAYRKENEKPERRRLSLIDVRTMNRLADDVVSPDGGQRAEAREAARARVETARKELSEGVPFAEVARRYSDGLHATEGGSWGWVKPDSVRERFDPAVKSLYRLNEGTVSDVIEYAGGFFLVRCDEVDDGGTPDFVSLQPELKDRFHRNVFNALVSELVEELRRKARIDPDDLDRLWRATVREAIGIVQESREGPPAPR